MTNNKQIMTRAWAIFRATYHYPATPFASIGKACFAWALRMAWWEAKEAARIAAISADTKIARAASLRAALEMTAYADNYRVAQHDARQIEKELAALAA